MQNLLYLYLIVSVPMFAVLAIIWNRNDVPNLFIKVALFLLTIIGSILGSALVLFGTLP